MTIENGLPCGRYEAIDQAIGCICISCPKAVIGRKRLYGWGTAGVQRLCSKKVLDVHSAATTVGLGEWLQTSFYGLQPYKTSRNRYSLFDLGQRYAVIDRDLDQQG